MQSAECRVQSAELRSLGKFDKDPEEPEDVGGTGNLPDGEAYGSSLLHESPHHLTVPVDCCHPDVPCTCVHLWNTDFHFVLFRVCSFVWLTVIPRILCRICALLRAAATLFAAACGFLRILFIGEPLLTGQGGTGSFLGNIGHFGWVLRSGEACELC